MATNGRTDVNPETGEIVEDVAPEAGTLRLITDAEIDRQISTAKRYPRSIVAFKRQALEMATLDEQTAGSMFYVLPRDGKRIEGPSVRLAEIVGSAWGNLRYGARIVEVGATVVRAQGVAYDLEKNVSASVEVSRRITDRRGKRYSEDMIGVTSNAACAVALRQAIFKVVPFAYVKDIYQTAQKVSLGKGLTMAQRRARAFEWFGKLGAKQEQVLKMAGVGGVDDLGEDELVVLRGIMTSIQEGETSIEEVLRQLDQAAGEPVKPGEGGGLDQLADKMEAVAQ